MIQHSVMPIEQSLCILSCQSDLQADISPWLSQTQSTTELKEIRRWLLSHTYDSVLLDMRNSPHKILSDIRYLKQHFSNCNMIALIDPAHKHWGDEAMRHGADACISTSDAANNGLVKLLKSLEAKQNQPHFLAIPSDPCTGLISAPLFFDRLNHALKVAVRHQSRTGILLISIDDYLSMLAEYDVLICDGVLSLVAECLETATRNSDSLARIHHGLFAVLLEDLYDEVMVAHIAKNIQQLLDQEFNVLHKRINLSVSIGGHLCEAGELNGAALYKQTQEALDRAMASGKQGMWFYIQEMNFKAMARLNMLHGLQRALDNCEFQLQYQPSHTGKGFIPNGVAPVICWKHPTAGTVTSEIFMDLLIDSGLIIAAGEWMIKTLFDQLNDWKIKGGWHSHLQLFLPITEKQLRNSGLEEVLMREMELNDMGSERIIITISEQTVVKNTSIINKLLSRMPNLGLAIELKGLSSGYNTFTYLKQMKVNYVCLDKDFFQHMHVDHLETSIVTMIVNLAQSLNIEVMAYGADSDYKVKNMQALGCNSLQGKYFSSAIYPDSWKDYLVNH
ncbi:MAG: diguanylate cyclase (GGDEF)-like protein [Bermanella sp.]|jgi:diguanylate cyclase (GGDEF)-like protein